MRPKTLGRTLRSLISFATMSGPRQWPAPWVFSLLILPLRIIVGFKITPLPFLLAQAGIPVDRVANVSSIVNLPRGISVVVAVRSLRVGFKTCPGSRGLVNRHEPSPIRTAAPPPAKSARLTTRDRSLPQTKSRWKPEPRLRHPSAAARTARSRSNKPRARAK